VPAPPKIPTDNPRRSTSNSEGTSAEISSGHNTLDEALLCASAKTSKRVAGGDYRWMRKAVRPEDRALTTGATAFLSKLPIQNLPTQCAKQYPRIINRMAELSVAPAGLREYLKDLCMGEADGRQGFPADVALEIGAVRRYYDSLRVDTGVWQDQLSRIR
jgi:hypothetical protein